MVDEKLRLQRNGGTATEKAAGAARNEPRNGMKYLCRVLKLHFRGDMFLSDYASYFQLEYLFFLKVSIAANQTNATQPVTRQNNEMGNETNGLEMNGSKTNESKTN